MDLDMCTCKWPYCIFLRFYEAINNLLQSFWDHYKFFGSFVNDEDLLIQEKVTLKSIFFLSSSIKSLYWVKLLNKVSASEVHAIPRNASLKKPKIRHRQPPFSNNCSGARPQSMTSYWPTWIWQGAWSAAGSVERFQAFLVWCSLCENAVCPRLFKSMR